MNSTANTTTNHSPARLSAQNIEVGYQESTVIRDVSLHVPQQAVTTIIGPNGCGKSTLLHALARLLKPRAGNITLDERSIYSLAPREVAQIISLLPQTPVAPDGMTVSELVALGRHPHRGWLQRWSAQDTDYVRQALELTSVTDLADRPVASLSGGQRQRVWLAMTLAQNTDILLLDEPTTYLDLAHSLELLDLVDTLCKERGRTVVMVLHDLLLATRYSDHLVVLCDGQVAASGHPAEIMDETLLADVFGLRARIVEDPVSDRPLIVPFGRRHTTII